jgi:hypothetical protein
MRGVEYGSRKTCAMLRESAGKDRAVGAVLLSDVNVDEFARMDLKEKTLKDHFQGLNRTVPAGRLELPR